MVHTSGFKVRQIQAGVSKFLHVCHINFIFQKAIMCSFHKFIFFTDIDLDAWKALH